MARLQRFMYPLPCGLMDVGLWGRGRDVRVVEGRRGIFYVGGCWSPTCHPNRLKSLSSLREVESDRCYACYKEHESALLSSNRDAAVCPYPSFFASLVPFVRRYVGPDGGSPGRQKVALQCFVQGSLCTVFGSGTWQGSWT